MQKNIKVVETSLTEILSDHFLDIQKRMDVKVVYDPELQDSRLTTIYTPKGRRAKIHFEKSLADSTIEAIKGGLAHELGHLVQYTDIRWRILNHTVFPLFRRVKSLDDWYHKGLPKARYDWSAAESLHEESDEKKIQYGRWLEKNADLIAIKRGCKEYNDAYWQAFPR